MIILIFLLFLLLLKDHYHLGLLQARQGLPQSLVGVFQVSVGHVIIIIVIIIIIVVIIIIIVVVNFVAIDV